MKQTLCFDDVLLVPQYSDIESRDDVDLSTRIGSVTLGIPIIGSPMDTVTEAEMAISLGKLGGVGVLHRFASEDQIFDWTRKCNEQDAPVIIAIGLQDYKWIWKIGHYLHNGDLSKTTVCLDVAHGDHNRAINVVKDINKNWPEIQIIAGSIATADAALRLAEAGANILRVGVGGGSLCSTRIVTGHGVPTLQSVMDIHSVLVDKNIRDQVSIIADGGIRNSADCVKSLVFADSVMLGSLLAGTRESPGQIRRTPEGQRFKAYRGMASYEIQAEKRSERKPRVEGVSVQVPYKGSVVHVIDDLITGMKSGLSYSGARNIKQLQERAELIQVTNNGLAESKPHHPYQL